MSMLKNAFQNWKQMNVMELEAVVLFGMLSIVDDYSMNSTNVQKSIVKQQQNK